ncbi:hypothetical protein JCM8547_005144 [Rhodosporidiobolus lusitaniae]
MNSPTDALLAAVDQANAYALAGPSSGRHEGGDEAGDGANNDRNDNGGKEETKPKVNKVACARCRAIKVRCQPAAPPCDPNRCARCTRLDLVCEWLEPQKRGRKAKGARRGSQPAVEYASEKREAGPPMDALAMLAATATPQITHPPASTSAQPYSLPATSSTPFVAAVSSAPFAAPKTSASVVGPFSQPYTSPQVLAPSPASRSAGPISYDTPGSLLDHISPKPSLPTLSLLQVAEAKEAALQNLRTGSAQPRTATRPTVIPIREPDPVDMRVLSELEAQQLFEHFHTKQNAFVILLDPYLHTVEYVRKTSTVLFTSVLAVSAKFIRPDLYPSLLMSAKQLVGRGIIDGKVSVGLIQSILLQVYYKEPVDTSAWVRIGIAIRCGYQMHLHAQRTTPLPDDELEAREILDRERTWIVLVAFDHTYLLQAADEDDGFHQTTMIPHYRLYIEAWLEETKKYGVVDDLEQGANFEWIKVQRLSRDLARARPAHARSLGEHLRGMLDFSWARYLDPASPTSLTPGTRPYHKVTFFLASANLALTRGMLIAVGTDGATLARWVQASSDFVDAFETIAKNGYVQYWQDLIGLTLYAFGEFSVKVFSKVYPVNQKSILMWLERIYLASEAASEGRADSTAAFISRFFQMCIRSICAPSTSTAADPTATAIAAGVAALPPPPPGLNGVTATTIAPPPPSSEAGAEVPIPASAPPSGSLEPFLANLSTMDVTDASYWESLFPGQTETDWSWLSQPLDDLVRI